MCARKRSQTKARNTARLVLTLDSIGSSYFYSNQYRWMFMLRFAIVLRFYSESNKNKYGVYFIGVVLLAE